MDAKYIDSIWKAHSKVVHGCQFSKHFFERLHERLDIADFGKIITYVNTNICMMIFDLHSMDLANRVYSVDKDIRIVVSLLPSKEHPTLFVKTVYKHKDLK